MRRTVSLAIAFLMVGGVVASSGVAYAGVSTQRPASFCGTAKALGDEVFQPGGAAADPTVR